MEMHKAELMELDDPVAAFELISVVYWLCVAACNEHTTHFPSIAHLRFAYRSPAGSMHINVRCGSSTEPY